ncbi:unnamed protein product [Boreogadus saida]
MQLQVLLESYDEEKDIITRKGNAKASATGRTKAWQRIADRLLSPTGRCSEKMLLLCDDVHVSSLQPVLPDWAGNLAQSGNTASSAPFATTVICAQKLCSTEMLQSRVA